MSSVMTRTVNGKVLVCLLGAAAAFGAGVHFLHGFQVKRNAGALLEQADRAEREGRPQETADYLQRYLGYAPQDHEALARYGLLLLDRVSERGTARDKERVFLVLDRVLTQSPERDDVRRRQAQLALELHRYGDAKDRLLALVPDREHPKDAEVEELLGQAYAGGGQYTDARRALEEAIRLAPDRVSSYVLLAQLFHRQPDDQPRSPGDVFRPFQRHGRTAAEN